MHGSTKYVEYVSWTVIGLLQPRKLVYLPLPNIPSWSSSYHSSAITVHRSVDSQMRSVAAEGFAVHRVVKELFRFETDNTGH